MLMPVLCLTAGVLFFGIFPSLPLGMARQISQLFFP
jgi:hypothetical protein